MNFIKQVPTNKPRINGNIEPELYELLCFFIALRRKKSMSYSQSKAVEECCNAFLSLGQERIKKLCKLAEGDQRSPSDFANILLKQALDNINEVK